LRAGRREASIIVSDIDLSFFISTSLSMFDFTSCLKLVGEKRGSLSVTLKRGCRDEGIENSSSDGVKD